MKHRRRAIIGVVVLVIWGLITHGTFAGSGDEPHYLIVSQSIGFDGDLDLSNNYASPGNLIGDGRLQPESHAIPGLGGALRPVHDIGLPLLFAPIVRLAYPLAQVAGRAIPEPVLRRARLNGALIFRHQISLVMALVAAALALQLFHIFRRHGPDGAAFGWALLITLSPPLLSHSFLFFTEIPSALLIVWVFRTLTEPDDVRRPWGLIGAATGFLLLLHVRNVAVVVGLLVWAAATLRRGAFTRREWIAWGAGAVVPLVARAGAMQLFWGTLLTSPHVSAGDFSQPPGVALREMLVRSSGLLFDQEFGLLPYAPVYLLFLPGVGRMRGLGMRGAGWAMGLAAAYGAAIVVPYVNIHGWTGGWAPAARMIAPVAPLLGLAVFACARSAAGWARVAVAAVVALQVVIDLVVWQWPKALWNYGDGTSALLASVPSLERTLPAWHGSSASATPFVVCVLAWLCLSVILARQRFQMRKPAGK